MGMLFGIGIHGDGVERVDGASLGMSSNRGDFKRPSVDVLMGTNATDPGMSESVGSMRVEGMDETAVGESVGLGRLVSTPSSSSAMSWLALISGTNASAAFSEADAEVVGDETSDAEQAGEGDTGKRDNPVAF
ncbi:hypothetical protein BC829DRAFT_406229 [Chytridium lagenaria]|nr:hypothetical protein BC829DRAFT_406229 [Chytridium lagenaria]